ncbi:hypothetical protein MAN_01733, partial [Metarhizium hybridum]
MWNGPVVNLDWDKPTPPPGNGAQDQEKYVVYVKKTLVRDGQPDPGTLDQFLKDKLDMKLNKKGLNLTSPSLAEPTPSNNV